MSTSTSIKVIAEVANAHQGSHEIALQLALAAAESGADAIKFQIYSAEELLTRNHARYKHFKNQAFDEKTWNKLLTEARKLDIEIYADVFGLDALRIAKRNKLHGLKVHSSDLNNSRLLDEVAFFEGKVFLAVGGSSFSEIKYAQEHVSRLNKSEEIILMHGFQAYPTKIEDSKLDRLRVLRDLFKDVSLGYMDHVDAESEFSSLLPLLAIPYGVSYIEKHITFNRAERGVDYYSSMEPNEFAEFKKLVIDASRAIGSRASEFSESERYYRDTVKKSWVALGPKKSGHVIKKKDLIMKRTNENLSSPYIENILERRLIHDMDDEDLISNDCFEQKVLAVIVARSESSRFPGKALADLAGEPAIGHLIKRVLLAKSLGKVTSIAFCTTNESSDDELTQFVEQFPIKIYRGEVEDVLSRMLLAVNEHNDHDAILRITGDDVLVDPFYLGETVKHHFKTNSDYTDAKSLPSGTEVEVFAAATLRLLSCLCSDTNGTEYLTNYITDNLDQFKTASYQAPRKHTLNYRLTIDTFEDYSLVNEMLSFFKLTGKQFNYDMDDIVNFMSSNSEIASVNKHVNQKAKPLEIDSGILWSSLTHSPAVTVYITNFNYGKYVQKSIESVLAQTTRSFEIIIIDDGSTDDSKIIIEKYAKDPRITVIFQENKGLNATNNVALDLAKGKYIVRLDADDYFHRSALSLMLEELECNPDIAMVFPDYYLIDSNGKIISHEHRHNFSSDVTLFDQPAHGACSMVRTNLLRELGGYSEEFKCQDGYELWIKLTKRHKVNNINLPLFYYRQHGKNLTSDGSKILKTRCDIIRKEVRETDNIDSTNWCIIPVREDADEKPLALRKVGTSTLVDAVILQAINAGQINTIIVTTNDQRVYDHIISKRYNKNVIADLRPDSLAASNVEIGKTIEYLLNKYSSLLPWPKIIAIANYEYPLRDSKYIDKLVDVIELYNADSSLSVTIKTGNLYKHEGGGLVDFKTNRPLRLERETVYEDCGGLHAFLTDMFLTTLKTKGSKVTHVLMDEISSHKVDNTLNLKIAEFLDEHKT